MGYRELPTPADMPKIFHDWLDWLPVNEDKPATTIRAYNQGVRRVISYSGIRPSAFDPASLGRKELIEAIRKMRTGGGVSKATMSQTLAALKSFFDFCIEKGALDSAPDISRIRKMARVSATQVDPEYYRPAEIRDLYAAAIEDTDGSRVRWPVRDLAMCSFLAVLGLRASELTAVDRGWVTKERLDDVDDLATWILRVRGKGRRIRRLPLSPELIDANSRWQNERVERFGPATEDEPLFVTNDGARFNYRRLRYWLLRLNREAALSDRSLHSLRHTAGVQLAADGVPMNVIQSLLGHASIATTGIYTELAGGELVGVLERSGANRLLGDALQEAGR